MERMVMSTHPLARACWEVHSQVMIDSCARSPNVEPAELALLPFVLHVTSQAHHGSEVFITCCFHSTQCTRKIAHNLR